LLFSAQAAEADYGHVISICSSAAKLPPTPGALR